MMKHKMWVRSAWAPDVNRDKFHPRLGEMGGGYVRLRGNYDRKESRVAHDGFKTISPSGSIGARSRLSVAGSSSPTIVRGCEATHAARS